MPHCLIEEMTESKWHTVSFKYTYCEKPIFKCDPIANLPVINSEHS